MLVKYRFAWIILVLCSLQLVFLDDPKHGRRVCCKWYRVIYIEQLILY